MVFQARRSGGGIVSTIVMLVTREWSFSSEGYRRRQVSGCCARSRNGCHGGAISAVVEICREGAVERNLFSEPVHRAVGRLADEALSQKHIHVGEERASI